MGLFDSSGSFSIVAHHRLSPTIRGVQGTKVAPHFVAVLLSNYSSWTQTHNFNFCSYNFSLNYVRSLFAKCEPDGASEPRDEGIGVPHTESAGSKSFMDTTDVINTKESSSVVLWPVEK
ncbi:hypothetical protein J6590_027861 [Homalodisca vitripennis]|nr:hypothetical protein J6590_027861 [Homalodisca vitripennis]